MSAPKEEFLARWSRRKLRDEAEQPVYPQIDDPLAPVESTAPDVPPAEETEEEALTRLGLPDPDTLMQGDDFTAFMRGTVPESLRRRALRRLWRSNPVLANLDGLNDYDGDFTGNFVASGQLKTLYEVGRGFLQAGPDDSVATDLADGAVVAEEDTQSEVPEIDEAAETNKGELAGAGTQQHKTQENSIEPAPKRMRFHFPDQ